MAFFAGEHIATIDDKGRMVLPSAFKKAVGELALEVVIVERNRMNKCLDIHPEKTWAENVKKFKEKLNPLNPRHDKLLQVYFRNFVRVSVASNGRINIPGNFLEYAGLEKNVRFIGMYESIRIIPVDGVEQKEISDEEYLDMLREINGENS